jgi:tRNA(fMet)-specific endonuclease VapC
MRRTLDTNICSYILRRHPASMIERFATLDPAQLWLSAVVAAELRFGAVKLASPRFSAAVEAWLAGFDVRPWPLEATHHYAQMRAALERAGKARGRHGPADRRPRHGRRQRHHHQQRPRIPSCAGPGRGRVGTLAPSQLVKRS